MNEKRIGLTSIGLDGEDLDALSFLPKPKIFVKAGTIVATAKETLSKCQANYRILEETSLSSALGPIVLIEITTEGNCLIGGPSSVQEMKWLLDKMRTYGLLQVLIDGAFFRMSLSAVSDACIYVVGANAHIQMEHVVRHFQAMMMLYHLEKTNLDLEKENNIVLIEEDGKMAQLPMRSLLDDEMLWSKLTPKTKSIWIPGVITPTFVREWLHIRKKRNLELIIQDATHVVLPSDLLERFMRQHCSIQVLKDIPIVAICYNPTSPKGYAFDDEEFRHALEAHTTLPLFNIKKEDRHE